MRTRPGQAIPAQSADPIPWCTLSTSFRQRRRRRKRSTDNAASRDLDESEWIPLYSIDPPRSIPFLLLFSSRCVNSPTAKSATCRARTTTTWLPSNIVHGAARGHVVNLDTRYCHIAIFRSTVLNGERQDVRGVKCTLKYTQLVRL